MVEYYGNVNPQLLEIIPQDAARSVEFGCGSVALLYGLKAFFIEDFQHLD